MKKSNILKHIVISDSDEDDVVDDVSEEDRDSEMEEREHLSILDDEVEDPKDDIRVVGKRKVETDDDGL